MKNLSVGKKIFILTFVSSFLIIGIFLFMLSALRNQEKSALLYSEVDVPALMFMKDANITALELRRYEKDMLLNIPNKDKFSEYESKWIENIKALKETLSNTKKLSIGSENLDDLEKINPMIDQYERGMISVINNIKTGKLSDPESANLEIDRFKNSIRSLLKTTTDIYTNIHSHAKDLDKKNDEQLNNILWILFSLTVFGLFIVGFIGWFIYRQIVQSLNDTIQVANSISQGDLTKSVVVNSKDEIGQLGIAFNRMTDSLRKLVSEVRGSVDHVSSASSQIVQGNLDLSSRTEQQASSLEQTAASMEEFTSSMQSNSDATKEAVDYVRNASLIAQRGGEVVNKVVDTMAEIENSSNKINDIIGVIDGIAFQTNILALNAAVEAARAGEQGRGFAVVASEVRNLAQRSATAAKEIKGLIQESVSKVGEGSRLVADAGQTMANIVEGVQSVTEIMNRISNSTLEQSSGVNQINQAVGQLDQMTQQNAALVEQASAAASSLQQQASKLSSAVSMFNLGSTLALSPMKLEQVALKSEASTVLSTSTASIARNLKPVLTAPAPASAAKATVTKSDSGKKSSLRHLDSNVKPLGKIGAKIDIKNKESDEWDEF
ncbi:MAG: methyl-accepting chemotaxis protein [Burkholderiales bacterium]|jgi:methyl-accepting chemotaxis protein